MTRYVHMFARLLYSRYVHVIVHGRWLCLCLYLPVHCWLFRSYYMHSDKWWRWQKYSFYGMLFL